MPNYSAPSFNKKFACIVNSKSESLAAVISSYAHVEDQYLSMFEFHEVAVPVTDATADEFDVNYIAKVRAKELSVRIYNALQSLRGCEYLVLGGLSENQKSYMSYLEKYNVIEINTLDEVDIFLKDKINRENYLSCNELDIHQGLYYAASTNSLLKIDNDVANLTIDFSEKEGLIVIERINDVSTIIGVNYAISTKSAIAAIEPPETNSREVKNIIERWRTEKNNQYFLDLSALIYNKIDHLIFSDYKFATFFTVGMPYSVILENVIPFTYVNLYLHPDFFVFNNILYESTNAFFSAIVFSPLEFGEDEETTFVIDKFKQKNYFVKELVGKEASVYNIDNHVKEFPYEALHICSHGGEVDGYSLKEEFVDRDGNLHIVEYDEVVSFAPKKGEEMIEVTSKYIWRTFDGLGWKSKELKDKAYPRYVFVDMTRELGKKEKKDRKTKKNIADSCAIKCSDFTYQAMFNSIAGVGVHPFIFNNTCWSWSDISQSFLSVGARGYIGTVWNIDNTVAKNTAEAFYANTFNENILIALQNALECTKGTEDENIYIFYGLHFSTLKTGNSTSESKSNVAKKLLNSFYRWKDHLERTDNPKTKELVNRLISWNHDQLFEYFFIEALELLSPKK